MNQTLHLISNAMFQLQWYPQVSSVRKNKFKHLKWKNYIYFYILDLGKDRGKAGCILGKNWGIHASGKKMWIRDNCSGDFIFYKGRPIATKWNNIGIYLFITLKYKIF